MRDLKDFSAAEWLRMQPLQDGFKQLRNDIVQSVYVQRRPKALEKFLQDVAHLKGRNVLSVVAFEQPWVLDWLMKMASRHLVDATLLVFDNSHRSDKRTEIERVCRDRNVAYLGLPNNPTRHVNRSHGMAMTWIFDNVVRAIQPRIAGFIDHDLIPMQTIEVGRILGDQPFFGAPNFSQWGWSLWAGYCLYDFAPVRQRPLNFLYDFSRELDTGGRNWSRLYRNYDRNRFRFSDRRALEVTDPTTSARRRLEVVDDQWLHLCGVGYNDNFRTRSDFFGRIAQAVDEGASLPQLLGDAGAAPATE